MAQKSITHFFKPKGSNTLEDIPAKSSERIGLEITSKNPTGKSACKSIPKNDLNTSDDGNENSNVSSEKRPLSEVEEKHFDTTEVVSKRMKSNEIKCELSKDNTSVKEQPCGNYNPAKSDYHAINDAFWKRNQSTPYLALTRTFQLIEEIRGRFKMIDVLSNFFSSVIILNPDDLLPCMYLCVNQLAPAYEGFELGVAETTLMKVIGNTTGRELKFIKQQTHITGDLSIVAEQSRISQRMMFQPAALTVQGILKKLRDIAKLTGQAKTTIIQDIFVACRHSEARFFIRSLIGKLRIGIAEQSLLLALATALVRTPPVSMEKDANVKSKLSEAQLKKEVENTALILKTAYSQCPNFDIIIPELLKHGIYELLERCPMRPGIPIKPMLAQPTKGVHEVLQRFQGLNITCEYKYDGERAQIHCDDKGNINIYSRNQENNTSKYPDIISRCGDFKNDGVQSYIIDSEIVAWDIESEQILPFQVLSTRKRKNVDVNEIKVQVCVYAFDLLYLNGKPLVTDTFAERRKLMINNFHEVKGMWQFPTACDTNDLDEVQLFLEESIKGNCEGLMVKTLHTESTYEIAKRSRNWLKLKKDYLAGVGDSLDLVVIGGYKGKGKRTGTYGGFLLACYDAENEEYQSICKIGTGFSEEDLRLHGDFFKQHLLESPKSYFRFDATLEPDEWFEPTQVWEVKCADLSLSPVHKAAIGCIDAERGISLRFPRFIRVRTDKSPENATSARQVAFMYSSQDQIKNQKTGESTVNEFENEFY